MRIPQYNLQYAINKMFIHYEALPRALLKTRLPNFTQHL